MRVDSVQPGEMTDGDIAAWRACWPPIPNFPAPISRPTGRCWSPCAIAPMCASPSGAMTHGKPLSASCPCSAAAPTPRSMPAGGPVCDYQALVAKRRMLGLDLSLAPGRLASAASISPPASRNNAVASMLLTHPMLAMSCASPMAGSAGARGALGRRGSKTIARTAQEARKLTRDLGGDVSFEPSRRDQEAFETLIALEARADAPHRRHRHVRTCLDRRRIVRGAFACARERTPFWRRPVRPAREGYKPAAVLFCLRGQKALHAWYVATIPVGADLLAGPHRFRRSDPRGGRRRL